MNTGRRWVKEKEAAAMMSVSVQTLRNWRFRGEGPKYHKPRPKLVRYDVAELENFMNGE